MLKALEFINCIKIDIELTAAILRSLNDYEKIMQTQDDVKFLSNDWQTACMNIYAIT